MSKQIASSITVVTVTPSARRSVICRRGRGGQCYKLYGVTQLDDAAWASSMPPMR